MSEYQTQINIAFSIAMLLSGWVLRFMYQALRDLQHADSTLVTKVQAIEVLVAGEYMKRDAFQRLETALFDKLDRIERKLDGKADK